METIPPQLWKELNERVEALEAALLGTLENRGRGLVYSIEQVAKDIYDAEGLRQRVKVIEAHVQTVNEEKKRRGWFATGWIAGAGAAGGVVSWLLQKLGG